MGQPGLVDSVATDHAPHTVAEKKGQSPTPGIPGLETMLPLLLAAEAGGQLSLERLVERIYGGPQSVYVLPVQPGTWVDTDPGGRYALACAGQHTKCGWTPFGGVAVRGRVQSAVLRGQTAFEDRKIRVSPGSGRVAKPVSDV